MELLHQSCSSGNERRQSTETTASSIVWQVCQNHAFHGPDTLNTTPCIAADQLLQQVPFSPTADRILPPQLLVPPTGSSAAPPPSADRLPPPPPPRSTRPGTPPAAADRLVVPPPPTSQPPTPGLESPCSPSTNDDQRGARCRRRTEVGGPGGSPERGGTSTMSSKRRTSSPTAVVPSSWIIMNRAAIELVDVSTIDGIGMTSQSKPSFSKSASVDPDRIGGGTAATRRGGGGRRRRTDETGGGVGRTTQPVEGGWGWLACGAAFVGHFISQGMHLAAGALIIEAGRYFDITDAQLGRITTQKVNTFI